MSKISTAIFTAVFAALIASPALASRADDAFNSCVGDINESVAKIVDAQAKHEQAKKIDRRAPSCTPDQIDAAYAALPLCEAALKKGFGADVRDFKGALIKDFSRKGFSLVLLTTTDAFFYHEDCDICSAIERCSLKDGSMTNLKSSHNAGCLDLAPFLTKDVAYSACPLRP